MGYTADELANRFRRDTDDIEGGSGGADYLWSDDDVYSYMYEAQRVFVRRTHLFRKTHPFLPAITEIAYTAPVGTPVNADGFVSPHDSIIRPLRARMVIGTTTHPLKILTAENLDEGRLEVQDYGRFFRRDWQDRAGQPLYLITDMQEDMWRIAPIPEQDGTLELTVEHLPRRDVTRGHPLEVTEREDQFTILLFMKHLGYLKQDADTYDKELSDKMEAAFEKKADDRRRELRRSRFRHQGMRYGGIDF